MAMTRTRKGYAILEEADRKDVVARVRQNDASGLLGVPTTYLVEVSNTANKPSNWLGEFSNTHHQEEIGRGTITIDGETKEYIAYRVFPA